MVRQIIEWRDQKMWSVNIAENKEELDSHIE